MPAYYNENDKHAAAWLRQLISQNIIAPGDVDERSITEVKPEDLAGYTQHHFFAGIGGWPLALQLAGWPDEKSVWTGSCPCQPFSAAGKNKGKSDKRHLWPDFFNLIKQCRPIAVFGEQVASAIRHGWLDDLQADMEAEGYAVGAAVLGAHSVGAYHLRQRLFWVARADRAGFQKRNGIDRVSRKTTGPASRQADVSGSLVGDAASYDEQWQRKSGEGVKPQEPVGGSGISGGIMGHAETIGHKRHSSAGRQAGDRPELASEPGRLPNPESAVVRPIPPAWNEQSDQPNDWLFCRDGKIRPVESGTFPLANGLPARVVRLRGYGNAIVPQVAAEFIAAFCEVSA